MKFSGLLEDEEVDEWCGASPHWVHFAGLPKSKQACQHTAGCTHRTCPPPQTFPAAHDRIYLDTIMSNFQRPLQRSRAMAPPTSTAPRRPLNRANTATPSFGGRASPADSVASSRVRSPGSQVGGKRKERDFDHDSGEGANINVVVRCRGRNDREVRENSGVVVRTDGLKGTSVELSMGPSALSNKTYTFDKVFSPAADQIMVFDEVVAPILDEVCRTMNTHVALLTTIGTIRIQLHDLRIRTDRYW